jgi:hypothetical protein
MTLRLGALHDALSNPGDQELARKASEEVASYQDRMANIERDLLVLKWMMGTMIALMVGQMSLIYSLIQRLPR